MMTSDLQILDDQPLPPNEIGTEFQAMDGQIFISKQYAASLPNEVAKVEASVPSASVNVHPLVSIQDLVEEAEGFYRRAQAKNTERGYQSALRHFETWCRSHGCPTLPAEPKAVILYLTELARTHKSGTLQHRLAAIAKAHREAGLPSPSENPVVRRVWAGIRREKGVAQEGRVPVLVEDLRVMVGAIRNGTLVSLRDQAMLLLGFTGAFRRSELVALDVEDLKETREGLEILVRRSKGDQDGVGLRKGVPLGNNPDTCPVRAIRAWRETAGVHAGPLFRPVNRHGKVLESRLTAQSVALVVKRASKAAGLEHDRMSAHSLRSGLVTSAAKAGQAEWRIARQTGHKSIAVLRRYIRDAELFKDNPAAALGL